MTSKFVLFAFLAALSLGATSCAKNADVATGSLNNSPLLNSQGAEEDSSLDELDPFAADIEEQLNMMDEVYEQETGLSAHISKSNYFAGGCRRETCAVWAYVSKSQQLLTLYVNGQVVGQFATSTGVAGRGTPNFDKRPNGRIYDRYSSTKFPGGDFDGLGNMPYAVFIDGGFAIHGTGRGNWPKLGRAASHGCIRIHPDNAYTFNRLVRQYGVANSWITVTN